MSRYRWLVGGNIPLRQTTAHCVTRLRKKSTRTLIGGETTRIASALPTFVGVPIVGTFDIFDKITSHNETDAQWLVVRLLLPHWTNDVWLEAIQFRTVPSDLIRDGNVVAQYDGICRTLLSVYCEYKFNCYLRYKIYLMIVCRTLIWMDVYSFYSRKFTDCTKMSQYFSGPLLE